MKSMQSWLDSLSKIRNLLTQACRSTEGSSSVFLLGDVEGEGGEEEDDGDVLPADNNSTKLVVQLVLTPGAFALTVRFALEANIKWAVQDRRLARVLLVAVVLQENIEAAV